MHRLLVTAALAISTVGLHGCASLAQPDNNEATDFRPEGDEPLGTSRFDAVVYYFAVSVVDGVPVQGRFGAEEMPNELTVAIIDWDKWDAPAGPLGPYGPDDMENACYVHFDLNEPVGSNEDIQFGPGSWGASGEMWMAWYVGPKAHYTTSGACDEVEENTTAHALLTDVVVSIQGVGLGPLTSDLASSGTNSMSDWDAAGPYLCAGWSINEAFQNLEIGSYQTAEQALYFAWNMMNAYPIDENYEITYDDAARQDLTNVDSLRDGYYTTYWMSTALGF